jgi:hypothetical protein
MNTFFHFYVCLLKFYNICGGGKRQFFVMACKVTHFFLNCKTFFRLEPFFSVDTGDFSGNSPTHFAIIGRISSWQQL